MRRPLVLCKLNYAAMYTRHSYLRSDFSLGLGFPPHALGPLISRVQYSVAWRTRAYSDGVINFTGNNKPLQAFAKF
jgi:hypothetical protein